MAKVYIDVPTMGYKTWLLTIHYTTKDGKVIEAEPNEDFSRLGKEYPYNKKNPHVR